MQRMIIALAVGVFIFGIMACGSSQEEASDTQASGVAARADSPDRVARAVEIAKKIQAEPDNADAILTEYNMTREDFEALLYDIAANPDLSRRYNEALAK